MLIAVALLLLVVGSIAFHFLSPWWFTPIASNWQAIDITVDITFWVTGFVFIAVNLFMAWAVYKYRHRPKDNKPAEYEPENKKLEIWLTVVTAIGVAAMLAPGLYVWGQFVNVPEEAWEFEALGEQWRWSFRLPGEDGTLGTTDTRFINIDNPFGIDPDDPNGQDDVLVRQNVVHIPLDKPVKVLLRSKDVLHDFAVPQFRVKMDLVPGLVSYLWFTPTRTGTFEILCEELCGVGHFTMRGRVTVDEEPEFQQWLAAQPTFQETQAIGDGDVVAGQALYPICAACHGAAGEGIEALNSPNIAGQHAWYLQQQISNFKTGIRGAHPDDTYGMQMAPMVATLVDDKAIRDISAYISAMPDTKVDTGIKADIENGKRLYVTCAACHGQSGEGRYAMNAPRISNQEYWYMIRQLENFKSGVRGAHPDDLFGPQMGSMARYLRNEQSIRDVVAYVTTLPVIATTAKNNTAEEPADVESTSTVAQHVPRPLSLTGVE